MENYKKGIDSLVYAVCGSGKTEIVLQTIKYAIECGEKVGFAIPRRDVVIELYSRFSNIFNRSTIRYVCGGHVDLEKCDLTLLTTHQLYRYEKYFDLLILDEIDAFPFKGSDVLKAMFFRAVKKRCIWMSATPSNEVIKMFSKPNHSILKLFVRYHHQPLPVPQIIIRKSIFFFAGLLLIIRRFLHETKIVFIFCPTINECEKYYRIYKHFISRCDYVHSKRQNREKIINNFRLGMIKVLFTTSVLERGVTFKDLQVIVLHANNDIYDEATLVQIAGRVGRKKDSTGGEVIFLANEDSEEMHKAIKSITIANKSLQNMLQSHKN